MQWRRPARAGRSLYVERPVELHIAVLPSDLVTVIGVLSSRYVPGSISACLQSSLRTFTIRAFC